MTDIKIIYFGTHYSGLRQNIEFIYNHASENYEILSFDNYHPFIKGEKISHCEIAFPIEGIINSQNRLFLSLISIPYPIRHSSNNQHCLKLFLKEADGIVFVADPYLYKVHQNISYLQILLSSINNCCPKDEIKTKGMAFYFQYNKSPETYKRSRFEGGILPPPMTKGGVVLEDQKCGLMSKAVELNEQNQLPIFELNKYLNKYDLPWMEANIENGDGIIETLNNIVNIIRVGKEQSKIPENNKKIKGLLIPFEEYRETWIDALKKEMKTERIRGLSSRKLVPTIINNDEEFIEDKGNYYAINFGFEPYLLKKGTRSQYLFKLITHTDAKRGIEVTKILDAKIPFENKTAIYDSKSIDDMRKQLQQLEEDLETITSPEEISILKEEKDILEKQLSPINFVGHPRHFSTTYNKAVDRVNKGIKRVIDEINDKELQDYLNVNYVFKSNIFRYLGSAVSLLKNIN